MNPRSSRARSRPGRWGPWAAVILIVGVGATAYSSGLHGPFLFDDEVDIAGNPSIRRLWPLGEVFLVPGATRGALSTRPVAIFSFAVNYAMGGLETFPYHLTNVMVHVLAGCTLFGFVRRTLVLPKLRDRFGSGATGLALAVALLWTLHPLQTQAVTYVVQRYESLAGLFCLLALYGINRSASSPHPGRWTIATVAATLAGLGSKEVAVSLPILILLYDRTFLAGSFREAWRRRRGMYLGLAAAWAVFAAIQGFGANRAAWAGYGLRVAWWQYFLSQPGVILHYLRLSFWPRPLVFDYSWPAARTAREILPGLLIVGALALATLWAVLRRPACGFLGAWFFLILAPTSSVLPIADLAFEHRMYLPLAAIVAAVVLAAHAACRAILDRRWLTPRGVAIACSVLLGAIGLTLAVLTWQRNGDYRSELSIWEDTAIKLPNNPRAHNNVGKVLAERGRFDDAEARFRTALSLYPDYADAHNNLAGALVQRGRFDDAIFHYRKALDLGPSANVHHNLAIALAGRGDVDLAIEHYQEALRISPRRAATWDNLALLLLGKNRLDDAMACCRKALEVDPDDAPGHNNLGTMLDRAGRLGDAMVEWRRAVQIKPDYVDAHVNLAIGLGRQGRDAEAIEHYRAALKIAPGDQDARRRLDALLRPK